MKTCLGSKAIVFDSEFNETSTEADDQCSLTRCSSITTLIKKVGLDNEAYWIFHFATNLIRGKTLLSQIIFNVGRTLIF